MPGFNATDEIYDRFLTEFKPAAERIKATGHKLFYHNHGFEFGRSKDGRLFMDKLLEDFSPELLGITFDTYWAQFGGADPAAWIEKPAGVYTKQVLEMNDCAKEHDVVFGIMMNQRTNCIYRKMREIVQSGELGAIRRTNWIITNWYRSQAYYDSGDWRATWRREGGGVLLNQCPHNLDLWQWICGMPKTVRAHLHFGKWHDIEVEDDVTAYVEYENGATGVFITTTGDAPGTNRFEISMEKGKLIAEGDTLTMWKSEISEPEFSATNQQQFGYMSFKQSVVETDGENPRHVGVLNAFASAILHGTKLVAEGIEGINGLTISNAMHLSAWLDKTVSIDEFDHELYYEELMKLATLCDISKLRIAELQTLYPDITYFTDAEEMMKSGLVEAVIIATLHYHHPPLAEKAFSYITEKPAGITCKSVRHMMKLAKESGKVFGVMFNQRTNNLFSAARDIVCSGELGELKRCVWIITNWYRKQSYYDSSSWRATWNGEGGCVLMNQVPHNLDLLQWICGMPVSILAKCDTGKYHNIEVEDDATIFARYENGATAVFITSTMEMTDLKYGGHAAILQNFARHILYGEPLIAPGYDAIHELTLSNAAYLSAWTGEEISLPMDDEQYEALLLQKIQSSMGGIRKNEREQVQFHYKERWNTNW